MKSLFHKLKEQLKCKGIQVSDEELLKPNQLPPHVKRYFMDYVDVYEIMNELAESGGKIAQARTEQQRDHLFYEMKLNQAKDALKDIQLLGDETSRSIATEALARIEI